MLWGHITLCSQVSTWTSRRLSQRIWAERLSRAHRAGWECGKHGAAFFIIKLLDSRPNQSCPVLSFSLSLQETHLPGAFASLLGLWKHFLGEAGLLLPTVLLKLLYIFIRHRALGLGSQEASAGSHPKAEE